MNPEDKPDDVNKIDETNDVSQPTVDSAEDNPQPYQAESLPEQSRGINVNKPDINSLKLNFPNSDKTRDSTRKSDQPSVSSSGQIPPKKSKKTGLLIFLVIVIVTLLAVVAYFALNENDGNSQQENKEQVVQNEDNLDSSSSNELPLGDNGNNEAVSEVSDLELKSLLSSIMAVVQESMANNNGIVPSSSDVSNLAKPFSQSLVIVENDPNKGEVQYRTSARCGEDGSVAEGSARQVILRTLLSDGNYYCID